MSEIKGQLLGIVLVVAVFGVVSTVLVSAFKETAESLEEKIKDNNIPEEDTNTLYSQPLLKF